MWPFVLLCLYFLPLCCLIAGRTCLPQVPPTTTMPLCHPDVLGYRGTLCPDYGYTPILSVVRICLPSFYNDFDYVCFFVTVDTVSIYRNCEHFALVTRTRSSYVRNVISSARDTPWHFATVGRDGVAGRVGRPVPHVCPLSFH